jgi:dUTP pyrophosphatase
MEIITTPDFMTFVANIKNRTSLDRFMYIDIFVDDDDDEMLKKMYVDAAKNHNQKILEDPHFYDAGFDLFLPKKRIRDGYGCGTNFFGKKLEDTHIPVNKVDFKVKCCARMYHNNNSDNSGSYFTSFYTYARSSISKTPLRLANNQGIIDAGYRGNLIGMFDCIISSDKDDAPFDWYMEEYTRILQICAPGLVPIYVNIVNSVDDIGPSTSRGVGGFGSTGK